MNKCDYCGVESEDITIAYTNDGKMFKCCDKEECIDKFEAEPGMNTKFEPDGQEDILGYNG